jgi:hypothetical protein
MRSSKDTKRIVTAEHIELAADIAMMIVSISFIIGFALAAAAAWPMLVVYDNVKTIFGAGARQRGR